MCVLLQYKQVQAFIPELFHKIKVVHETGEGRVEFNWKRYTVDVHNIVVSLYISYRVRVFNHTVCLILYQMCLEVGSLSLSLSQAEICLPLSVAHGPCDRYPQSAEEQVETPPSRHCGTRNTTLY